LLVKVALAMPEVDTVTSAQLAGHEADRLALRAWYTDWAETARTLLRNRNALIRLGLARRQKRKAAVAPDPIPVNPPVAPLAA
jgi:hypothetical protein